MVPPFDVFVENIMRQFFTAVQVMAYPVEPVVDGPVEQFPRIDQGGQAFLHLLVDRLVAGLMQMALVKMQEPADHLQQVENHGEMAAQGLELAVAKRYPP